MFYRIKAFLTEEHGATMVEYALMIALIALASIAVVGALGDGVFDAFDAANTELHTRDGPPVAPTTPAS